MSAPAMQILVFFSLLITVLFASLLYFAEGTDYSVAAKDVGLLPPNGTAHLVAPEEVNGVLGVYVRQDLAGHASEITPVHSIPWCFWWVLVTMTTVGYGDLSPTTSAGKVVGIALFYVGIIFLALPITILGTNFEAVYSQVYGAMGEGKPAEARDAEARPGAAAAAEAIEAASPSPTTLVTPRDEYRARRQNDAQEDWRKAREERKRERRRNSLAVGDFLRTPWVPRQPGLLRTCFVLFEDPSASRLGKLLSVAVMAIIFISCTTFCMETMPSMRSTKWKRQWAGRVRSLGPEQGSLRAAVTRHFCADGGALHRDLYGRVLGACADRPCGPRSFGRPDARSRRSREHAIVLLASAQRRRHRRHSPVVHCPGNW